MSFVTYVLLTGIAMGTQNRCVEAKWAAFYILMVAILSFQVHSGAAWCHCQFLASMAVGRGLTDLALSVPIDRLVTIKMAGSGGILWIQICQVSDKREFLYLVV